MRFPKGNAEDFPGHGNASGASAGCKVERGVALEKVLESRRGNTLDIAAKLTAKGHPARLVAIRASRQETEKRRREHRADAKRGAGPHPRKP